MDNSDSMDEFLGVGFIIPELLTVPIGVVDRVS